MTNRNHYAVIMAGGIGSRFWPLSRSRYPKQFLDVLGTGKTLLQQTYERFAQFILPENIFIIGAEAYKPLIKAQLPRLNDTNVIAEPSRKNTAPCVAYAVYKISSVNADANLIIAPSDHVIMHDSYFVDAVESGFDIAAAKDALLTLGVRPTRPDTGYGYIQYVENGDDGAYKVKTFVEKPTHDIAEQFYNSGDYLWNAGIFIGTVKSWHRAFQQYMPELDDVFKEGRKLFNTPKEPAFIANAYMLCPNVSIDIGIMEKAKNVLVIPAKFDWSDLGTWASLYTAKPHKDYMGNAVNHDANVMTYDTTNSMIHVPPDKLVVLEGLDDYIVIDTQDVLLVCKKSKEQDIKNYVSDIRRKKGDKWL